MKSWRGSKMNQTDKLKQKWAKKRGPKDIGCTRVYIPDWYQACEGWVETIGEAMSDLRVEKYTMEEAPADRGAWLFLFGRHFPPVKKGKLPPRGEIEFSATNGYRVTWVQKIKSNILVRG